jgi:putative ABC transport system permease protein
VAIVNEAFAKAYFGGEDPVGKWFETPWGSQRARIQIVGLVRDARYRNMREPITAHGVCAIRADRCAGRMGTAEFGDVHRAHVQPEPAGGGIHPAPGSAAGRPEFRVSNIRTQQELIDRHTIRERLLAALALFFAAVGVMLGGVGMYGVLDYSVLQRRREISIRMAIGAPAGDIARLVTADVLPDGARGSGGGPDAGRGIGAIHPGVAV